LRKIIVAYISQESIFDANSFNYPITLKSLNNPPEYRQSSRNTLPQMLYSVPYLRYPWRTFLIMHR
jgi:hypothetical protein